MNALLSGALSGAAMGSAVPGIGTVVGAAAGLLPAAFKFFSGRRQQKQANAINPVNPNFQMNTNVIDNARILGDRYNNYQMAGYGQALNNLQSNYSNSFAQGAQGASSGGDVLDLATKLAYGQNQATNNLAYQSAQGKDAALGQYLGANAAAGQEYVNKNAYDRQMYDRQLAEKAALTESAAANKYGAIDQLSKVGSKLLTPNPSAIDPFQLSPQSIAQIQALLGNYQGQGIGNAAGDLYKAGSVGVTQKLTGKLPF